MYVWLICKSNWILDASAWLLSFHWKQKSFDVFACVCLLSLQKIFLEPLHGFQT